MFFFHQMYLLVFCEQHKGHSNTMFLPPSSLFGCLHQYCLEKNNGYCVSKNQNLPENKKGYRHILLDLCQSIYNFALVCVCYCLRKTVYMPFIVSLGINNTMSHCYVTKRMFDAKPFTLCGASHA